ncbi:hypothetical protein LTS00_000533 [Friedmanniomyces endolithicus]|uniref:Cytochrome P450 n=1 Tax=Friedmanniomyces endolithicus TaxID=329885 RepID=A0AAN6FT49_9PEZI|nr:hypothetical protein LTS00_000533 [Friedmanniomyces endolithicus]KAK0322299.1 hypothetical protein LTR82_006752 [Friedmanniomyces endolithicus]
MLSYLALAISGLCIAYAVHTYRCFNANLAAAKQSGIPYINFLWTKLYTPFRDIGSDMFLLVAPGANTLYVADPEAISQITTRRNDFPKPIWMYASVDIYGKSVVSTEGANWRHHRKITSPPFTEKNNHLVWQESVHQANSMVASMVSADVERSGSVWNVAAQAMRLSLHVISKAGFGVRLPWPHEEVETKIPEGHTLSYKDALSSLLENIIVVMLTPTWLLGRSPLKIHKAANESFLEWGKYMRELYEQKKAELQTGESRDGMDLMGALVKGAGITGETNGHADPEKAASSGSKQLLTDDEIFGNAFVFILAGHETAANTIHFAMMLLAMHPQSQRRLQKDLDDILGDRPSSEWDYDEDVPKLFGSMCGAVMNEELRLIPPVVGIPKMSTAGRPQGLQLGGKHVTVPADCSVTLDTVALHRNPKYWPHTSEEDLLDFRPERWLVDGGANGHHDHGHGDEAHNGGVEEGLDFDGPDKRPDTAPSLFRPAKGAYIPFSDGYRSCLGRRFAQVEILAVLAVVFKTWSIELCVGLTMSDEELEKADEEVRRSAWEQADQRARELLRTGMMTIITIQMRKGKVPMRFVKRGSERFDYAV